jgi:hypothetical protein
MRRAFENGIQNPRRFTLCATLRRCRSDSRCRAQLFTGFPLIFCTFATTALIVGLKICTRRLNNDVAASVAPTLMTLVVAAALSISAFGTGILICVAGMVNSVTS